MKKAFNFGKFKKVKPASHPEKTSENSESGYVTGSLKWAIAFTVYLGAILEVIDTSIVNVALNEMQATLGATVSEIGWVVTGYAIANVILIPLTAWLGDYFGRKRYFIFSMVGFTIASVMCGLAPNLNLLIISRILQGLCGGGLLAKAQAILFETFPPSEQGIAQAVFGVGVIAGPAIGPTLEGMDLTTAHEQALTLLNQTVNTQAAVLSYADVFRFVALVFFCSLPLLFFLGKGAGKNAPPAH